MALGAHSRRLWRQAPVWRALVLGGCVFAVMAVLATMRGGGGGGGGVGGGGKQVAQPVTTPIPPNVVQVQPSGPPIQTMNRIAQMKSMVDAANGELRAGQRCANMSGAADAVQTEDLAYVDADPDAKGKYKQALQCVSDLVASDERLDALASTAALAEEDRSAAVIQRLARAREALGPFDESRERFNNMADALAAGDGAREVVAASDARIQALNDAAAAARDGAGAALARLAGAGEGIIAIDRARMNAADEKAFEAARTAAERVAASERRMSELRTAVAQARTSDDGTVRQRLIDGVAALTPFDTSLTGADAEVKAARELAGRLALATIVERADGFDPDTASVEQFEHMANLGALIERMSGAQSASGAATDLEPRQARAIELASLAAARLAASDRRIGAMRSAASAWARAPGSALEDQVRSTHDALTPFDRARLDDAGRRDLATAGQAIRVLDATQVGLTADNRSEVPIFVGYDGEDERVEDAGRALRDALSGRGYRVVAAEQQAAVAIRVGWLGLERRSATIGSQTVETSEVSLDLTARWTFDDEVFFRARGEGSKAGRAAAAVDEAAVLDAVDRLAVAFDEHVETGPRQ